MASRVQLSGPQEAEKYVLHMVSMFSFLRSLLVNFCPCKSKRCLYGKHEKGRQERHPQSTPVDILVYYLMIDLWGFPVMCTHMIYMVYPICTPYLHFHCQEFFVNI